MKQPYDKLKVEGVGIVPRRVLENHVIDQLKEILKCAEAGEWLTVNWMIGGDNSISIFPVYVKSLT